MKRLLAVVLVICCLFVCVPALADPIMSKTDVASIVQNMLNNNKIEGLEVLVNYDTDEDTFFLFFVSEDIANEAAKAKSGKQSAWKSYKGAIYTYLTSTAQFIATVCEEENPNVTLICTFKDSGEYVYFYALELTGGKVAVTIDTATHDTEPVVIDKE